MDAIAQAWLPRHPSRHGLQHALVWLDATDPAIDAIAGTHDSTGAAHRAWRRLVRPLAAQA